MTDPAVVIVRRQVLDIEFEGSEAASLELQRRLGDLCDAAIAPALDVALGSLAVGTDHLVIDRLEIDLDRVALDRLAEELGPRVRRELARHPVLNAADDRGGAPAPIRRSEAEAAHQIVAEFLVTGRRPWWAVLEHGQDLEGHLVAAWGSPPDAGSPPEDRRRWRAALARPDARARLIAQFSQPFVLGVIACLAADSARLSEPDRGTPTAQGTEAGTRPRPQPPTTDLRQRLDAVLDGHAPAERAGREHREDDRRAQAPVAIGDDGTTVPGPIPAAAGTGPLDPTIAEQRPSPPPRPLGTGSDTTVPVDHAGLVLLHPFLPRFLEALGVCRDDQLLDPPRAVGLLHHLVTGAERVPEHEATLAKVLCEIPTDQPIPAELHLRDEDRAEARSLLEAVIAHWGALGSSSPDALRSEFLMRPGSLSVDDHGMLLRVEPRSVDVLLDQLPWGTSMVQLPWQHHVLRVEWGR